jgi:SAM-dependent methyltransferase
MLVQVVPENGRAAGYMDRDRREIGKAMNAPPELRREIALLRTPKEEFEILAEAIREKASAGRSLNILEAGCGPCWYLDLAGVEYRLTGVDLDQDALNVRQAKFGDLDEAILGDLRTVALESDSYDVIYNSFVLEHLVDAEGVLDNFLGWLKPGGLLILKIPDKGSVYGYFAKCTPHWFHVLYKRYVEKDRNAGKPGFAPFPTVYEDIVSRRGIHDWCAARGLTIRAEYGANYYFDYLGLFSLPVKTFVRAAGLLSLGRLAAKHSNLTYVIEKPATVTEDGHPEMDAQLVS